MNRIHSIKRLCKDLIRFEISIKVPHQQEGPCQYVLVKTSSKEPSIILPVIKTAPDKGTLTVIAPCGDEMNQSLQYVETGNTFYAVEGPFTVPVSIDSWGSVLCVANDKNMPFLLSLMASLRIKGNRIIAVVCSSGEDELILKQEAEALADELYIIKFQHDSFQQETMGQAIARILRTHSIGQVIVTGNARIIKDIFSMTISYPVEVQAVLVCSSSFGSTHGVFKVAAGAGIRSVCVDGHNFNAYYSSFEEMIRRFEETERTNNAIKATEKKEILQH